MKSKTFKERVVDVVKRIPAGETLSYKEVARRAGSPRAARAVGNILKGNLSKDIPCHRVIKSDGSIGKYNNLRGKSKKKILKKEGARNA